MNNKNTYNGKLNAAGISIKIALYAVLWICLIDLAYSGCAPSLQESQVARMCRENEASGSTIYIDTSQANETDSSSGPLCICNLSVSNAKYVTVRVQEKLDSCGSKLKFSFIHKQMESDENKCGSYKEMVRIENQQEMRMSIEKIVPPYSVDFCTKIEIEKCSNQDDYQCDSTAKCIAKTGVCDAFPDCPNGDDEGDRCISVNQGEYDTSTEAQPTTPIINIQCYESTRFLTTSTTTTTTTTTTPSTTTTPANSKENGPVDDSTKDDDVLTTVKKPYVIAGLVVAALVLVAITTCLVLAVRRKMKKS